MEPGTLISIIAALIALASLILNSRKETRTDAAALARIDAGLTTANNGINDIRVDVKSMQKDQAATTARLAKVEALCDSNTRRIEALEG